MMQQIKAIIQNLETDPYYAITVTNLDTFKVIACNNTGAILIAKHQTVEAYFMHLINQGITNIAIQPRRKNGTSFKDDGVAQKVTIAEKSTQLPAPVVYNPAPVKEKGLMGSMGLGFPELVNLHVSANDKVRLETENKYLKDENDRLKIEVTDLKEERLKNQYSETKARANTEMLTGAFPLLAEFLPRLLGASNNSMGSALNAPAEIEDLPAITNSTITMVKHNSTEMNTFLTAVNNLLNTNAEFYTDLSNLIDKYNNA